MVTVQKAGTTTKMTEMEETQFGNPSRREMRKVWYPTHSPRANLTLRHHENQHVGIFQGLINSRAERCGRKKKMLYRGLRRKLLEKE